MLLKDFVSQNYDDRKKAIRDKIENYLAYFIDPNSDILNIIAEVLAEQIDTFYQELYATLNFDISTGIFLTAEENRIFFNNKRLCIATPGNEILVLPDGTQLVIRDEDLGLEQLEGVGLPSEDAVLLLPDGETYLSISEIFTEEEALREKLAKRLDYLTQRGTEKGIQQDLESLFGLKESTLIFKDYQQTGIIAGVTNFGDNNFVGVDNLIEFYTTDKGYIVHRDIEDEIVKKRIIPTNTSIIFIGE
jgi:hypothetical protein